MIVADPLLQIPEWRISKNLIAFGGIRLLTAQIRKQDIAWDLNSTFACSTRKYELTGLLVVPILVIIQFRYRARKGNVGNPNPIKGIWKIDTLPKIRVGQHSRADRGALGLVSISSVIRP